MHYKMKRGAIGNWEPLPMQLLREKVNIYLKMLYNYFLYTLAEKRNLFLQRIYELFSFKARNAPDICVNVKLVGRGR